MSLDCIACTLECCNSDNEEIRHGVVSLAWVAGQIRAGRVDDDILDRLDSQIERINTAMTNCGRRVYVAVR